MIKKSVKHLFNFIFSLMLSLCFALSYSTSSYCANTLVTSTVLTANGNLQGGNGTKSFTYSGYFTPLDDSWYQVLGGSNLAHCVFDVPLYANLTSMSNFYYLQFNINYFVYIDYMDSNLAAQQVLVDEGSISSFIVYGSSPKKKIIDLSFDGEVAGTPTGIRVDVSLTSGFARSNDLNHPFSVTLNIGLDSFAFSNVAILDSNNETGKVEVEYTPEQISTNGLMSTNGFSPLILATNGNVRYFENLGLYDCKFGYPAFNMSDFESGSSAQLTLFEGQYDGVSVHPVAFMGDCRKGEYEVVFGFITSSNPIHDQGVDFSSGWTGELVYSQQAFALFTNDTKYNYRVQYNPIDGYFYNTVWIRFETDREFDSLTIRTGPRISGLVHGAFCVNKFVGTVADQLNLDNYQWNYQPTNINQFNQNNSSTGGAINSADSAEQGFFDNYDTAVSSSGIENFDLSVIGNSLLFVQTLVNRFYNILPDKLQYLIFASLVFGVLGAILGVTRYVIKHESRVSRSKASDKKGD